LIDPSIHGKRRLFAWTAAACCLAVVTLLTACKQSAPPPVVSSPAVPVTTVTRQNLSNELTLSAEFTPYQDVDVMAKVAGYVKSIPVDIGDHVAEGQVLATLEVPELQDEMAKAKAAVLAAEANVTTAKSGIARAQATADMAHLSYTRIQDVAKGEPGLVPRQEVDVAQSRDAEAGAGLASAQSALQSAEQSSAQALADRDRAAAMLQYATIRAPFAGVITKRYANTGSMIQAGTASQSQAMPLVRLAQINVLRLTLPVPVSAVSSIHVGEPVDVDVTTLGRKFSGTVTRFSDSLQMSTRTMDTEVDVPNKDGTLVAGMYAEVQLHLEDRPQTLNAPLDAVDGLGGAAPRVFVVRSGRIHIVSVKTGVQTPERVELLSGVQEGDKLVVGRHTDLAEGEQIDPHAATYETPAANR
jgi:RND family efflux transporter MFP subunit